MVRDSVRWRTHVPFILSWFLSDPRALPYLDLIITHLAPGAVRDGSQVPGP